MQSIEPIIASIRKEVQSAAVSSCDLNWRVDALYKQLQQTTLDQQNKEQVFSIAKDLYKLATEPPDLSCLESLCSCLLNLFYFCTWETSREKSARLARDLQKLTTPVSDTSKVAATKDNQTRHHTRSSTMNPMHVNMTTTKSPSKVPANSSSQQAHLLATEKRLTPPLTDVVVPNIGSRKPLKELEEQYDKASPMKVQLGMLEQNGYPHYRPIRGDGNCYYRAVMFGFLEQILLQGNKQRLHDLARLLSPLIQRTQSQDQQQKLLLFQQALVQWESVEALERDLNNKNNALDEAMVMFARMLLLQYLDQHKDKSIGDDMFTLGQRVAQAAYIEEGRFLDGDGLLNLSTQEIEQAYQVYKTKIGTFKEEAFGPLVQLGILGDLLGCQLILMQVTKWGASPLYNAKQGQEQVVLFFRPGHYDLLYPQDSNGSHTRK
ncbi:MAG: hypothetical protein FJZ58_02295 [Chlamydiae bacterium]|nr:hypothetical protein [Chlamydiota bacterium]